MDPNGKLAFITGAAGGIGESIARALGRAGARLVIADIDARSLAAASERLAGDGLAAKTQLLDVADRGAWREAIEAISNELGPISILCNNAAAALGGRIADLDASQWERLMAINVNGILYSIQAFVPHVKAHGQEAHIVNMGSIYGLFSGQGAGAYITSKFAVVGLSEVLRFELQDDRIGVSVICPGLVDTDFGRNSSRVLRPGEDVRGARGNHGRMDPVFIGPMVVEAINENRMYVVTHPEYRSVVDARHKVMLRDFGQGAQPGYSEDPSDIGGHWLRLAETLG